MSDKDRAKKLAAARKKLKAYQTNEKHTVSANDLRLIPDSESGNDEQTINISTENINVSNNDTKLQSYFENNNDSSLNVGNGHLTDPFEKIQINNIEVNIESDKTPYVFPQIPAYHQRPEHFSNSIVEGQNNCYQSNKNEQFDTIQLLIADKAELTSQLGHMQTALKEKSFQIEEINTQLINANIRIHDLETNFFDEQRKNTDYFKEIQNLEKRKGDQKSLEEHLDELNKELGNEKLKINELNKIINEKNSELELNNIRIKQISDETNITIDNRIETLTQTKFMYEQQIVDLQSMVQQLRTEKDQANQQYQNYVQHLTKDVNSLSDKKSELMDENSKLLARESDFIKHISSLEKQIQQNILKSEALRENQEKTVSPLNVEMEKELSDLKEKIKALEVSKLETESMLSRQKEDLKESQRTIQDKANKIVDLEERIEHILAERPNDIKLLATIESDKIAASRAMSQNSELRKQLDEVQLKLIDLTNDKMDLTTTLDSERHTNKEMHITYDDLSEQIKTLNDKIFFKDEEMIRLIHENSDLNLRYLNLKKQLGDNNDHSSHEHSTHDHSSHEHSTHEHSSHVHSSEDLHCHNEQDENSEKVLSVNENKPIENGFEVIEYENSENHTHHHSDNKHDNQTNSIPTTEAMQRLEERFKKLISEVADLTDEKQRLEHLVLQLQGETETIGEYITLYQTQRRMLKQKEIEKDAQLHRLSAEREEFRESLAKLTQLINRLGLNIEIAESENQKTNEIILNGTEINDSINNFDINTNSKENQTSDIIVKEIYSLINELKGKDNVSGINPTVDHCACCSGKFETI